MYDAVQHIHTLRSQIARHTVMAATPERLYILPHPGLREIISHYTVYMPRCDACPGSLAIVPDASGSIVCRIARQRLETHLWGPSSRVAAVENNPQKIPLYIMAEFFPCGANRLLHIPMDLLHNTVNPLEQVDISLSRLLSEQFEMCFAAQSPWGIDNFLTSLDQAFLRRMEQTEQPRLSRHIIREIRRFDGLLRGAELARRAGCSERHLNRIMSEELGMTTKLLSRVIRVNAACLAMTSPRTPLTRLAHALHYHDQSHFIHDFRAICGVTPGEYLRNMSVFYNEELKFGDTFPKK